MDEVQVDLGSRTVTVTYDPMRADAEAIKLALESGGDVVRPAQ